VRVAILRPIVRTAVGLPQRVRDLQRLREVAQVLVRHGFGLLVTGLDLPGLQGGATFESTPERVVTAVQELGPTFVKLGQVLSTRPDLLPEAYIEALQALQDDVKALDPGQVTRQIAAELGPDWRERFGSFEEAPLATASIAQVHAAVLPDGREVVLKVQRPGIEPKIQSDLAILHFLAGRLVAEFPEAASLDLEGVLGEFSSSILSELDFHVEASNQTKVARSFAGDARVRVPAVIEALTTQRVLVMERLRGVKMREARAAGCDMELVGKRYLGVAYDMLFIHGFFHGDLHPGNVLVLPGDVIGLLDFGMMGRLTPQMRSDVIFIMFALQRGDYRTIARLFYDIAIKQERVDYRAIERDTVDFLEKNWTGETMAEIQLGPAFAELVRRAAEHGARVPSDYTMFFKALVTSEGLARSLIAEVDPIKAAVPYFERLVAERFSADRIQSDVLYQALTISTLLRRLPATLAQLLDDVDAQRVRFQIRHVEDPEALDRSDRRQNRLVAAVLTVGFSLCGVLALGSDGAWWRGWPVVGAGFFGLAFATGATALWLVWSGRTRR
jgi:ubiquinone biosynthesis protein